MEDNKKRESILRKKRENILKAVHFEKPDYIPMTFGINTACWFTYPVNELLDLMEDHPLLFPDFVRPKEPYIPEVPRKARKNEPYIDDWGCLWETSMDGIVGTVTKHPLADWDRFDSYQFPDPSKCMGIGEIDWDRETERINRLKQEGLLTYVGFRHGHTFLQVCDIRGYENVLFDMIDEEPRLKQLLDGIFDFNMYILRKYLDMGVDVFATPDDLGMQVGPMISPNYFDQYIMPYYRKMLDEINGRGVISWMHSDGDIRQLAPFLMDAGMQVLNLQDLVNGVDWIQENLKGKICVELDIDRQKITPYGTPKEIDQLILDSVKKLGSPQGGLAMDYGLYPGVPLENVKAVMDAMEKYAFYYN